MQQGAEQWGLCTKEAMQSLVQTGGLWGVAGYWGQSNEGGATGRGSRNGNWWGEEEEGNVAEVCEMGRCVCTAGGRLAGCTRVCVCVCVAQGWSRVQWPGPPWATSGVSNSRSTWSTASNQSSARMAARWAEAAQFPLRTSRSAAARGMPLDKSGRALLVNL